MFPQVAPVQSIGVTTCGPIGPNYVTATELSLTAAPKVYRALIIHLASTVNQETRSLRAAAPKPHNFLVG